MSSRAEFKEAQNIKEVRERMEERRDQNVQAVIIDKRTGEIVDRNNNLRHDNAESWAQKQIYRKAYLKYQIITVV